MAAPDREKRWSDLLRLLAARGRLTVEQARDELGVSAATVRRDFGRLAAQQLVTRTHGGVVAASVAYDLPARYRTAGRDAAKSRIAAAAAAALPAGARVGFNGGTTTTATARELAGRHDLGDASRREAVTIVTNALNIASEMALRPAVRCVCLGGVARPESYEQTGPFAIRTMNQLWLDVLVLGVDALAAATGAGCGHDEEAGINETMVRRSSRVVVVATGDKIGRTAFCRICEASAVDALVTDPSAPGVELDRLRRLGIEVTVVGG